jgi:TetR/AcrR family transcriptional regulator, transcriptional repressor of bet genes
VLDGGAVVLWAGYMHKVRGDAELLCRARSRLHRLPRHARSELIAALPATVTSASVRREAIACNALIDGLWVEGSLLPHAFAPGEMSALGLTVGRRHSWRRPSCPFSSS